MTKLDAPLAQNAISTEATAKSARRTVSDAETSSFADQLDALSRTKGVTSGHGVTQLLALVAGESNFKPHAHNRSTGATGPFQFVKSTWLSLVKQHGEALGIKKELVAQIETNSKGRPSVGDPDALKTVLALRNDMALSTRMAVKYLDDNRMAMSHHLHRQPSESELQVSFLLGPSGAAKLIKAAAHTPEIAAADLVPHAAAANRHLFYNTSGEPRTAAQAVAFLASKYRSDKAKTAAYLAGTLPSAKHSVDA